MLIFEHVIPVMFVHLHFDLGMSQCSITICHAHGQIQLPSLNTHVEDLYSDYLCTGCLISVSEYKSVQYHLLLWVWPLIYTGAF